MPIISPQSESLNVVSGSGSNSCYVCVNGPTVALKEYLVLTFANGGQTYDVNVIVGKLYRIKYYDATLQQHVVVSGMVTGISENMIALTATTVMDGAGDICLCANKEKLAGYIESKSYHIPTANISGIISLDTDPKPKPTPMMKEDYIVAILGISSTVIRSIIIRLRIFNDDVTHTVTNVDMQVGKNYHVTYCSHDKDHTLYEIEGQLIRIEEIGQLGNERSENGYVRPDPSQNEVCGCANNIYDPGYFYSLPKNNPEAERIKFVFDTSKQFQKMYDTVMLVDIRGVEEITEGPGVTPEPPCPPIHPPVPPCPCDPLYPPPPPPPPMGPCDPVPPCGPNDVPIDPWFGRPVPPPPPPRPWWSDSTTGDPIPPNHGSNCDCFQTENSNP